MNQTYKVVFNQARGSMTVVNERMRSAKKIGAKTVLVSAAALLGTVASAAGAPSVLDFESLPDTAKFIHFDGQPTEILTDANGHRLLADVKAAMAATGNKAKLTALREALSQYNPDQKTVILLGAAGNKNYLDKDTFGTSLLISPKLAEKLGVSQEKLQQLITQFARHDAEPSSTRANINLTIGNDTASPIMIGTVGGNRLVNAMVTLSPDDQSTLVDTLTGNVSINAVNGNLMGLVAGSSAISVNGPGASYSVFGMPVLAGTHGNAQTTVEGNTALTIGGGAAGGFLVGAGSAAAVGGTATSTVTGTSTVTLDADFNADKLDGLVIGAGGGALAVATHDGEATGTVQGKSTVNLTRGEGAFITAGGLAIATDTQQLYNKIPANRLPDSTGPGAKIHLSPDAGGTASVTSADVALNIGKDASGFFLVGGGVAMAHQFGTTTKQAVAKTQTGDITITIGEAGADDPLKDAAVHQAALGKIKTALKVDGRALMNKVQNAQGMTGKLTALMDPTFVQHWADAGNVPGMTVAVLGGGIALSHAQNKGLKNDVLVNHPVAGATGKDVSINIHSGYTVGVAGGAMAVASGNGINGGEGQLATGKVANSHITIDGGRAIGVLGGGIAAFAGSHEAHTGVAALSEVDTASITVDGADTVKGLFGGGLAFDGTDPADAPAVNAQSRVKTVNVSLSGTTLGRLHVESLWPGLPAEADTRDDGMGAVKAGIKNTLMAARDNHVALIAGGVAVGRAGREPAGELTRVDSAAVSIADSTVGYKNSEPGNLYAGGMAVDGAVSSVGTSTLTIANTDVYGDLFGSGVSLGTGKTHVDKSAIALNGAHMHGNIAAQAGERDTVGDFTLSVAAGTTFDKAAQINGALTGNNAASRLTVSGAVDFNGAAVTGFNTIAAAGGAFAGGIGTLTVDRDMRFEGRGAVAALDTDGAHTLTILDALVIGANGGQDHLNTAENNRRFPHGTRAHLYLAGPTAVPDGLTVNVGEGSAQPGIQVAGGSTLSLDLSTLPENGDAYIQGALVLNDKANVYFDFDHVKADKASRAATVADADAVEPESLLLADRLTAGEAALTTSDIRKVATLDKDTRVVTFTLASPESVGLGDAAVAALADATPFLAEHLDSATTQITNENRGQQLKSAINLGTAAGVQTAGIHALESAVNRSADWALGGLRAPEGHEALVALTHNDWRFGNNKASGKIATNTTGVTVGMRAAEPGLSFGAYLSADRVSADGKDSNSGIKNKADLFGMGAFVGKPLGDYTLTGHLAFGAGKHKVQNNTVAAHRATVKTRLFNAGVRVNRDFAFAGHYTVSPFAGLDLMRVNTAGYTTSQAIRVDEAHQNLVTLPVGVSLNGRFTKGDWALMPQAQVAYRHAFGDVDATSVTHAGALSHTSGTTVWMRDTGSVRLGLDAQRDNVCIGVTTGAALGTQKWRDAFAQFDVKYAF